MTEPTDFSAADGDLFIRTGVTGPAARTGHRLRIVLRDWRTEVTWDAGRPVAVVATVVVNSLEVVSGEGGLTPMSGPERALARTNALKSLGAKKFAEISYRADDIAPTGSGYRLSGDLTIGGRTRPQIVELDVADEGAAWHVTGETRLTQTDFGVKPYSLAMGTLKVADEVVIGIDVRRPKID
ncbi:YceI family protein [Gordonia sp. ABSL1-1]|uniref:YceI family protein n=1 Tax=Gordonia sp. ABSL1-1 TaxID=3053923 RepID=UPI002572A63A|nr:YceI family protein [Gordonia sp. ABSL1-1]MDL9937706.1 YceI family protein [Gordonia sp. ABSL1-1]